MRRMFVLEVVGTFVMKLKAQLCCVRRLLPSQSGHYHMQIFNPCLPHLLITFTGDE